MRGSRSRMSNDQRFVNRRLLALAAGFVFLLTVAAAGQAVMGDGPGPFGGSDEDDDPPGAFDSVPLPEAQGVVRTVTGVVLPVMEDGSLLTPCANTVSPDTVEAADDDGSIRGAHVVLDPGHGGFETGAVGPNGLAEEDINLDVAFRTKARLEAEGATVVLTREDDYKVTLETRAAIANALGPAVFVSIHHNTVGQSSGPTIGSELYHRADHDSSRRLGGLVWEEYRRWMEPLSPRWQHGDPGVRARLSPKGGDYYGVLRGIVDAPAVLSEAAFLSDPDEAALMTGNQFRDAEARAITDAIIRFISSEDNGSGFLDDLSIEESAGGGGSASNCDDPPLG